MKQVRNIVLMALCVCMMFAGQAMAGKGKGCNLTTSTLLYTYVLDGVPVNISGIVAAIPAGDGLKIDDGNEVVTAYGLGPIWYWESISVDRPTIGDNVDVDARLVTFSDGSEQIIMMSIEVNGTFVQLRDPVTGSPLWL